MTAAWKQASGHYPSVQQLGAYLNECLQYPVFNIHENVEVGQNEITWFANQLTALSEDVVDASGRPLPRGPGNPYGPGKPFDASVLPPYEPTTVKWSAESGSLFFDTPDNNRYRSIQDTIHAYRKEAASRGFRLPPDMEQALERIHTTKGVESTKAAFEDMMGNLARGKQTVTRTAPTPRSAESPRRPVVDSAGRPIERFKPARPGSVKPSIRPLIPGGWKTALGAAATALAAYGIIRKAKGDDDTTPGMPEFEDDPEISSSKSASPENKSSNP